MIAGEAGKEANGEKGGLRCEGWGEKRAPLRYDEKEGGSQRRRSQRQSEKKRRAGQEQKGSAR